MFLSTNDSENFLLFGQESTYQFSQLCFGFLLAPRVFTKMTKVLASKLSRHQINIMLYLANWLIAYPLIGPSTLTPT